MKATLAAAAATLALGLSAVAKADEIVVFSSAVAKSTLEAFAPEFERDTKHKVKLRFATAVELKGEIEKGAACDVALLTAAAVDDLIKQAKLDGATRMVAFKSGVGVTAKKGTPKLPVATADELMRVVMDAKAIALSATGATGPIMRAHFEKLGIADAVTRKTVLVSGITVPQAVARGQADLGFTQISEILEEPEAQLLGPLPANLQTYSTFVAATSPGARSASAAQAFVKALATPAAKAHMTAKGLQPE